MRKLKAPALHDDLRSPGSSRLGPPAPFHSRSACASSPCRRFLSACRTSLARGHELQSVTRLTSRELSMRTKNRIALARETGEITGMWGGPARTQLPKRGKRTRRAGHQGGAERERAKVSRQALNDWDPRLYYAHLLSTANCCLVFI